MQCLNNGDTTIITVKGASYRCIIYGTSKSDAINLLKNYVLVGRVYICQKYHIKNHVYNFYFDNLVKAKKIKTKTFVIDRKNYKDLVIYFTRCNKSIVSQSKC